MQQSIQRIEELFSKFEADQDQLLKEFFEFLKIESISSEPNYKSSVLSCADWVCSYLKDAGLEVELWPTSTFPVIFASWLEAGPDKPTVLIYNHYDIQPVDPLELWTTPPFEPTIRQGEIYARGAQDNKGQCFYVMAAIKYLLQKEDKLPVNLKLCIEGEEEIGSPGLYEIVSAKQKHLKADHLLIVDLGLQDTDIPTVTLGLRGTICITVELSGSETDLHSGTHGGVVYNPNHAMVELLSKLRDSSGKISIPGFYDQVTTPKAEDIEMLDLSFETKWYENAFGAKPAGGEKNFSPIESSWLRPTVEINGIGGGYAGEGFKTVIPAKCIAKISCRLVPNQDPDQIGNLVANFLKEHTPDGVSITVTVHSGGGEALRTNPNSKVVHASAQAFSEVLNKPCKYILSGASIPIVPTLSAYSQSETVLIGYGLSGDQIHAPNEHFGVDRLKKGFATIIRILEILGAAT